MYTFTIVLDGMVKVGPEIVTCDACQLQGAHRLALAVLMSRMTSARCVGFDRNFHRLGFEGPR